MPVEIQFSENKRYIVYVITDPVNINELLDSYKQEKIYRDSVDYVVHSIVDMSRLSRIPPNWLTAKAGPGLTHPRSGEMLFVGLSKGFKLILNTIFRITRYTKMKFFDTREEADAHMATLISSSSARSGR